MLHPLSYHPVLIVNDLAMYDLTIGVTVQHFCEFTGDFIIIIIYVGNVSEQKNICIIFYGLLIIYRHFNHLIKAKTATPDIKPYLDVGVKYLVITRYSLFSSTCQSKNRSIVEHHCMSYIFASCFGTCIHCTAAHTR